ncbi:MAG: SOS response-associated peptidase [Coriobacteriales bacterium]
MCGRFFIALDLTSADEIRRVLGQAGARAEARQLQFSFEGQMRPSDCLPTLACDRSLVPSGFPMTWGWRRRGGGLVINARSETAARNAWFAQSARRRRCLVPASWYFEWRDEGGAGARGRKQRYALRPRLDEPWYLGGLYALDERDPAGARLVVLTRAAAADIAFIHDRMPLLVPSSRRDDWLDPERAFPDVVGLATDDVEYARDTFVA